MQQIICFDIDGVLTTDICFTEEDILRSKPNIDAINLLHTYYKEDFVVLYTARRDELIYPTLKWLQKHSIKYHAISNIKIPASKYIDDKAENYRIK